MKRIIYLTVISLVFQSCIDNTEKKLRNHPWVSASGSEIIEIKGDSILFTYLFKDTEKYKFELKDNTILLNDSISYGTIDSITDNLLKLGMNSGIAFNNLFFPVKTVDYNMDTVEFKRLLLSNPWSYKKNDAECSLDFMEGEWFVPKWNFLWSVEKIKDNEGLNVKDWTIKMYNGTLFLLMIEHGSDLSMFQIMDYNDSTLFTSASFDAYAMFDSIPVNIIFKRLPSVDSKKLNQISNLLTKSKWKLSDYEILDKNYEFRDGRYYQTEPGSVRFQYNDTMKKMYNKYYSEQTLHYIFTSSNKGYITVADDTIRRGHWELSTDGKYIWTNPPSFFPCLKIIELNDSVFICENSTCLEFMNQNANEFIYIKETLERKTWPKK